MNQTSRRAAAENEMPGMRNPLGKEPLLPATKSKSRVFENAGIKSNALLGAAKMSAAERQRLNAEKLSKGYSVVHGKNKEQAEAEKEKPRQPLRVLAGENVTASSRLSTAFPRNPGFRVPDRPLRQKKPATQVLQKTTSVTSLFGSLPDTKSTNEVEVALSALVVVDDDKKYEKDEFLLGLYAKDIYNHLRVLEKQQCVRDSYLTNQHIMTEGMRAVLVDWIFEVKQSFDLLQDTVQIAIGLLDRFLQDAPRVPKEELQLVGVTCIFIAAKYEEMYPPSVMELVQISAEACYKKQILRMEQRIFHSLGFSLGRPPPVLFLRRYCRTAQVTALIYSFSKYIVDLALVQYKFCHLRPSLLAAAALYLALLVTNNEPTDEDVWSPKLIFFSEYTLKDLKPIIPALAKLVVQAPRLKTQSVQQMYGSQKQLCVSTRPELKSEKILALSKSDS